MMYFFCVINITIDKTQDSFKQIILILLQSAKINRCLQVCQLDCYSPSLPVQQSLMLSLTCAQSKVQSADFTE